MAGGEVRANPTAILLFIGVVSLQIGTGWRLKGVEATPGQGEEPTTTPRGTSSPRDLDTLSRATSTATPITSQQHPLTPSRLRPLNSAADSALGSSGSSSAHPFTPAADSNDDISSEGHDAGDNRKQQHKTWRQISPAHISSGEKARGQHHQQRQTQVKNMPNLYRNQPLKNHTSINKGNRTIAADRGQKDDGQAALSTPVGKKQLNKVQHAKSNTISETAAAAAGTASSSYSPSSSTEKHIIPHHHIIDHNAGDPSPPSSKPASGHHHQQRPLPADSEPSSSSFATRRPPVGERQKVGKTDSMVAPSATSLLNYTTQTDQQPSGGDPESILKKPSSSSSLTSSVSSSSSWSSSNSSLTSTSPGGDKTDNARQQASLGDEENVLTQQHQQQNNRTISLSPETTGVNSAPLGPKTRVIGSEHTNKGSHTGAQSVPADDNANTSLESGGGNASGAAVPKGKNSASSAVAGGAETPGGENRELVSSRVLSDSLESAEEFLNVTLGEGALAERTNNSATSSSSAALSSGNRSSTLREDLEETLVDALFANESSSAESSFNSSSIDADDEDYANDYSDYDNDSDDGTDWYYNVDDDGRDYYDDDGSRDFNSNRADAGNDDYEYETNDQAVEDVRRGSDNYYRGSKLSDEEWIRGKTKVDMNDIPASHPGQEVFVGPHTFEAEFGPISEVRSETMEMHQPFVPESSHDASLSILVFYTWIGIVTVMVIGAFIALKHRHRILKVVQRFRSAGYFYQRRRTVAATRTVLATRFAMEEGQNLLTHQHV